MQLNIGKMRALDVRELYLSTLSRMSSAHPCTTTEQVIRAILKAPAPRFYLTAEYALRIVSLLSHNKPIPVTNHNKIMMYHEIYRRYLIAKEQRPKGDVYQIIKDILKSPAPSFYVSYSTLRAIVYTSLRIKNANANSLYKRKMQHSVESMLQRRKRK
jgi:hypothetical protein